MHKLYSRAASLTHDVIAAAIEVHRVLGPGLLEWIHEWALRIELESRGDKVATQQTVEVHFKQHMRTELLRFVSLVEGCLLVETKAVETVHPIHKAQLQTYTKLLDVPLGLIINFNELNIVDGLSRPMLPGADRA